MNNEILLMADVVSREKNLDKEVIFSAIESALAIATQKRSLEDIIARVVIDRNTGRYETFRVWEVVSDDTEDEVTERQLPLCQAQQMDATAEVGDVVEAPLEPVKFGRIAAQAAKQVIMQKVREAERAQVVSEYQGRVGEMLTGLVRRMERGDTIIDLGGAEALLPRNKMIPREGLRPGDRIRALLEDVRSTTRGPQLFLNRISPALLIELFKLEVPEAGEGLIEIKGAARDPGLRAKIAVYSHDGRLDPVGACVGMRGSRVQSVSNEICGERVDIIKWSNEPAEFVLQALAPAEVLSIVVDEEAHAMDVVVHTDELSRAIGRGGQNVHLASQLTGWDLNIMTEEDAGEKVEQESARLSEALMRELDVDENVALILVQEEITSIEEVAYLPREDLLGIEEFDENLVDELRRRAEDALLTQAIVQAESDSGHIPEASLLELEGMNKETARLLAAKGIKDSETLAEYAVDELLEEVKGIDAGQASALIMAARAPWFVDEESQ
ncbi:MAG TPA: transcription termination/antitermination protein NusA [Gammaproteobacteria bacterium]|nr:transcription termination/antitermination protein NusA [Gammaproteobacteria bacterium]